MRLDLMVYIVCRFIILLTIVMLGIAAIATGEESDVRPDLYKCGLHLMDVVGYNEPDKFDLLSKIISLSYGTYDYDSTVLAIIAAESAFNSRAVSSRGAVGLMQITKIAIPDAIQACPGIEAVRPGDNLLDPGINILVGKCYLLYIHNQYGGYYWPEVLTVYNGGWKQRDNMLRTGKMADETTNYVVKVLYYRSMCRSERL